VTAHLHPDVIDALVARLRRSDDVSDAEVTALRSVIAREREYPNRAVIVRPGQPLDKSLLLLDGFVARQTELPNGRRQILAIHVPGDFLDLHGFLLKSLDHDVVALSQTRLAEAPHDRLREVTSEHPHVSRLLWFSTMVDAAIHREWISSLGRTAAGRIAHLFCELQTRLEVVGRADSRGYTLPLTQIDLADATALTPVHVNRTLMALEADGLIRRNKRVIHIIDWKKMAKVADFQPRYLHLDARETAPA